MLSALYAVAKFQCFTLLVDFLPLQASILLIT